MSSRSLPQRTIRLVLPLVAALTCLEASAVLLLHDDRIPEQETDYRTGRLLPDAAQLRHVERLQARANWNRFGTIHSLIRHGGYLGTGYGGTPVEGARAWVRDNRVLFKLSEQGVSDLDVVNEGIMPHTQSRAVLFRQRFGGLKATHDGLITVGIAGGKVYYASSSSAGDQPPIGAAVLTPVQAWLAAAADVKRFAVPGDILLARDATAQSGWHLLDVAGFSQPQRARLVAIPIPSGGVRQAYETIVIDVQGDGSSMAWVHFIDAETGAVLLRENRLQNYADLGTPSQVVSGSLGTGASCSLRHAVELGSGATRIVGSTLVPTNRFTLNLYRDGAKVASADFTGNGALDYAPAASGTHQLELCPQNAPGAHFLPPYNYVASVHSGDAAAKVVYNTVKWTWYPSSPSLDFTDGDTRKIGCFGADQTDCDEDVTSVAARQPWDMLAGLVPTFTSIGNSAITEESPISAVLAGAPGHHRVMQPNPLRNYDYAWSNTWYTSQCLPVYSAGAAVPAGNLNDIDATIANLFVSHNRMHDWSYALGFTERNYNLQLSNFGITDVDAQNDPELGLAQAAGPIGGYPAYLGRDNANQFTLQDGVPGITQQYLFQPIGGVFYAPCTDGAFEMSIIGHEYTHAISNRMVGGPDQGLGSHQGGSMGESWGDLAASEYMFAYGYLAGGQESIVATAAYVAGSTDRSFRNFPQGNNPLNFTNVGYDTPGAEVHSDGEIWNATMWAVRQALIDKYESQYPYADMVRQRKCADDVYSPEGCPGNRRWVQLMFDSFLLMPAAPSMLDARDAMLAADIGRTGGADQVELWAAFAARGMGISAFAFDGSDQEPIGAFDSPLSGNASVHFSVAASDGTKAPVAGARLYVGQFATRTRWIADTDDATSDPTDAFPMIPGTYDFMVEAPGYGIHRFRRTIAAGTNDLRFELPTNWASAALGAAVVSSATSAANVDAAVNLIDDSENTGAIIGEDGLVSGAFITVQLSGGEQSISRVHLSTAAGPDNPGRYTGVRSFEIRVCSGTCQDLEADFATVAYTSAEDAIPGRRPRPNQNEINLRSFDFAAVRATHVQLRVLTNQCTGHPGYAGEQDADPLNNTDCATTPLPPDPLDPTTLIEPPPGPGTFVRATDLQVFSSAPVDKSKVTAAPAAAKDQSRYGGALAPLMLSLVGLLALGRRRR